MRKGYFCCFFDIVNGFLIDAVVHWFACMCRAARLEHVAYHCVTYRCNIWLRLSSAPLDNADFMQVCR